MGAKYYTEQFSIILNIAKSLPLGYWLYVKEHPVMKIPGWRDKFYYQQIMDLPNVKMLHHTVHPKNILPKCSMVITIGGTAGFEAAFYEKPTITFVDTLYSYLKSVEIFAVIEPSSFNQSKMF